METLIKLVSDMSARFILRIFLVSALLVLAESATARQVIHVGETFTFNIPGKLIVKRETKLHKDPQYLFADESRKPCSSADSTSSSAENSNCGSWTTDGKSRVGHGVLYWNGTLVIENVSKDDAGTYSFPLETPRPHLAATVFYLIVEN